ncbi:MAG: hypothetical protein IPJ65_38915 [Archangiaceae bacterium]|nr:hypothetical protein [Archangiaceae bacterium]
MADVLYLLPVEAWRGFWQAVRTDLLHPGVERSSCTPPKADGSWRHYKAQAGSG